MTSVIEPYNNIERVVKDGFTLSKTNGIININGAPHITGTSQWVTVGNLPSDYIPQNQTFFTAGTYEGKAYVGILNQNSGAIQVFVSDTVTDKQIFMCVTYM